MAPHRPRPPGSAGRPLDGLDVRAVDGEGRAVPDEVARTGTHLDLFPEEILAELGRCERLVGLTYDEAEHHQNNANCVAGLDRPSILDPAGFTLERAADAHTAGRFC